MVSKAVGKGRGAVRFSFKPSVDARSVQLAGEFNQWQPLEMSKARDGSFATQVFLQPGTFQYKFVVDGQWISDPDNQDWVTNQLGSLNSVATVR